ncbi:hypothetical protein GCM10014715_87380 [Streptomyces spiralis]|uniref:Uncharacterized protein n=1 Tax=Streptomyces spiralis TaxID=66376 RepID=A0A919E4K6_9ACTN|nr:hypothetical protein [Streptomyces spiralis]GHF19078.1 hypothetical protein GCM10014715_87380 [Streptomyces spiralis]
MRFTLGDTPLKLDDGAGCAPDGVFTAEPGLEATWWTPRVGEGDGRPECSGQYQFRVVVEAGKVYAWSNGDLVATG